MFIAVVRHGHIDLDQIAANFDNRPTIGDTLDAHRNPESLRFLLPFPHIRDGRSRVRLRLSRVCLRLRLRLCLVGFALLLRFGSLPRNLLLLSCEPLGQ